MKYLANLEIKFVFFIILMLLVTVGAFQIFSPFINIIIVSLILVQLFHPYYRWFLRKTKSKAASTFLSIIITLLFFIIPVAILIILTIGEIQNITQSNNIFDILNNLETAINEGIARINEFLSSSKAGVELANINLADLFINLIAGLRDQLLPIVQQFTGVLFTLFILIICLIFIFPDYDTLHEKVARLSPLDDKLDLLLFRKFKQTIKGVIKGSFIVAILQATAVLIPMLFMQIGAPVLLWIIMVVLSLVPIGSGLVWAPVGIAMIIGGASTGNSIQAILGIGLIIYSAIIINVIDTTFRPKLMKDTVNLHPLVTILSALGGITYFGILGILYGPLIMVFFHSIMSVYRAKYLTETTDDFIETDQMPLIKYKKKSLTTKIS